MMHVWSHRPQFLHLGLFVATYVLGAGFAQALAIVPGTGISIWPPSGLFVATLVYVSRHSWPWWVLGGCLAEIFSNVLWFHNPLPVAFLIYTGNALEAVAGAWLVNWAARRPVRLETLQEVLALVVLGAGIAPVVSATVGSATLAWFGMQTFAAAWPLFWLGDATGVLIAAPLALVVFQNWRGETRLSAARWMEACVLGLIFLGVAALSLSGYLPFAYIIMPPLLWAAVRFEFKGAAVALAFLALITAVFTISGASQFVGDPESQKERQVMLQLFLAISAFSALIVAALSRQHREAVLTLRQSVEALRERERELSLIIDTIPALVWSARPDGSADFVNQHFLDYVGLPLEQVRDSGWTSAYHPDDFSRLADEWATAVDRGQAASSEGRLRRLDGEYRWFLLRANPLHDERGNIVSWYGVNTDIDEKKRAQEAVAASERNLKLIINTIPGLVWSARPDGSAEFFNQHYLDYVGLSAEQAQGWGWAVAVHPDDLSGLTATWQAIMASEKAGEAEARLRRFDGDYRWLLFRANPLRDASGNIVKWYGVNTDIDDRKRAETNLAREKQLLEMIASGRPLRAVLSALCEMVEEAGPGCYCDVHPIDWSGPSIEYSVAPSLPASYTDPIAGLSLNGDALPCAIAVREKVQVVAEDMDTDPRWHDSSVRTHVLEHGLRSVWSTPIHARDGRVLGTLCLYQRQPASPSLQHQNLIAHATHLASIAIERSRTEAALRRSETLLAEGQQLSSTGSFSWRVDTDEIAFSEELCRIFEFDPNGVVTLEQFRARVHPEDMPSLSAQIDRIRAGHGYPGYEIRLLMPDVRVKYLRTFGRVVRHQDGRLECLAAVQDVTERRLADEALTKARSELAHVTRITSLGALTASIAHEVNQPLSGIITNAGTCLRMLAADPPNMDGARETARRTIRDGNRAADVITRLRTLFSKRTAAIEPVDLSEAAGEVIDLLSSDLQRSRVVLRTAFADGLPLVGGDRIQLQQVLMNLLRNAADAMSSVDDRPRLLVVRTESDEEDHVSLSVQDAGIGFGPEAAERLFEAFYTTKNDSMGIGLSVSRSIIESHHGRLWAASNDGPGATFSFSISKYSGDEAPAQDISAAGASVISSAQNVAGIS